MLWRDRISPGHRRQAFRIREIDRQPVDLLEQGTVGAEATGTRAPVFRVHGIPSKGNTADKGGSQTRKFLLVRYATQAPDLVDERNAARDETEKDRWSVVGCASTEPTNTSYPITTHTPNVQLTQKHQSFQRPFRHDRTRGEKTDETEPKPHKREKTYPSMSLSERERSSAEVGCSRLIGIHA